MPPRLAPLDPPYDPEVADALARLMGDVDAEPLKLFRTIAHHRAILERFRQIGSTLLAYTTLDPVERETVIHRVTARAGAEYEWGVHAVAFARPLGLGDEWLWATVHGGPDDFDGDRQRVLVWLADELHETATVSPALYAELEQRWPPAQIVELLALAGFYRLVSYLVNSLAIEREPWAARWSERYAVRHSPDA
jgi:4-carboxymuconolactone decarboxylase